MAPATLAPATLAPATLADVPSSISDRVLRHLPVGSSTIPGCEPKDRDLLLLVDNREAAFQTLVEGERFEYDGSYRDEESLFLSCRKGDLNLIITQHPDFYRAFGTAHALCVKAQVVEKDVRVWIHNSLIAARASLP